MRFAQARQGVLNAVSHLSGVTQLNNFCILDGHRCISWNGRTTGIQRNVYYPLEYQFLLDRQQYSLLLSDGSFFQFFYAFDAADHLQKARLAYYPRPLSTKESPDDLFDAAEDALVRSDDQLYEHLYNWTELMEQYGKTPSNSSHVRLDFDRGVTAHAESHLQFSGVQEFRLPANFYPQPLAFIQLCESMLEGVSPLQTNNLAFEKSSCLRLAPGNQLISIGCIF